MSAHSWLDLEPEDEQPATFAVGDWVVYRPHPDAPAEDGEITEIRNEGLVLVRYEGDRVAKPTRTVDLERGTL